MTGKEMVKLLQLHGWVIDRIRGSHHVMKKDGATIPVPVHGKQDLKKGLEQAILKKAGLT